MNKEVILERLNRQLMGEMTIHNLDKSDFDYGYEAGYNEGRRIAYNAAIAMIKELLP